MNSIGRIILGLFFAVMTASFVFASGQLDSLITNSPFMRNEPEKPAATPPVQLELRGVVVEGEVVWFTFYDGATKQWTTLRQGEEADSLLVKEYNRTQDLVALEFRGKAMTLALKSSGSQYNKRSMVASVASVPTGTTAAMVAASTSNAMVDPSVPKPAPRIFTIPPPSDAEAKRLELVASNIRQVIEASKLKASASGANHT
jgi:hypothetical protein